LQRSSFFDDYMEVGLMWPLLATFGCDFGFSLQKFCHVVDGVEQYINWGCGISPSSCWSLPRYERFRPDRGAFWVLDPEYSSIERDFSFQYKSVRFSVKYVLQNSASA